MHKQFINTRHKLVLKHSKYRDIVLPDEDDGHQALARQYLDNSSYLTPGLDTPVSRPFFLSDAYTPHAGWQTVLLVGWLTCLAYWTGCPQTGPQPCVVWRA